MTTKRNKVVISLGTSVYSNEIVQKEITISQLFKRLSEPKIQQNKDGRYFIFASFTGKQRNAKSVKEHYGAVIDLDDTSLTLEAIKKKFAKHPHCIYSTHSHKAPGKGDRFRLVLPYKNPIDNTTHVETMLYLMDSLGAKDVDLSSKALSRPMYLPAVHPKRKKHFEYFSNLEGLYFNPLKQSIRDEIARLRFESDEGELAKSSEPFNPNEKVDEGGRNDALARFIGKTIKTGMAVDEVLPMAESWNQLQLNPPLNDKEVKTIFDSIVNSHKRNHGDLVWGYDEIISRIKKSEDIANEFDHILDIVTTGKSKKKLKNSQIDLIIDSLAKKSKVGKRTIQQELTSKELELAGRLEESNEEGFESTTENLRKDFKQWVYVASDDRVYNLKTGEYYKREAFAAMFATPNVEGSLFGMIMKYNLMKKVSRLEFDPSEPEIYIRGGVRYANTYIPPDIFPLPGSILTVLKHFEYLIPDDYERKILLDFIAHLVQHPGVKIRWMPVIKGGKGIGKTIIAEKIILPIIGFTNFGKVNNEVIKSDFNAWQLDKQLVVFEELDIGANQKEKEMLTDKLKSFITDNILTAHRKGLDPYDTINKANALAFTNKDDAIIITPDERRFCMIRTDVKPKPDGYYQKLANFTDKNLAHIYYFFMERDLSDFSPLRAPETDYTKEVKSLSMGWPGSLISQWLEDSQHPIHTAGCATHHQLVETIKAESTGRYRSLADDLQSAGSAQAKKLYYALRNFGFTNYENPNAKDGRIRINGKLEKVWLFPDSGLTNSAPKLISRRLRQLKIKDENWHED